MPIRCDQCDDAGYILTRGLATECECRRVIKIENMLERAGLPTRYQQASFENFDAKGADKSIRAGLLIANKFCEEFPTDRSRGLLFTGPVGVGKTHLAIAALRRVALDYTARIFFADFRDLLKQLQGSFDGGPKSRTELMKPVMGADVLVLDELGAAKPTDWTFEIAEEIINNRYNEARATIFTTNLPNLPPIAELRAQQPTGARQYGSVASEAMRTESLGDRLGARMFSRVQQMCRQVEMTGPDYRRRSAR